MVQISDAEFLRIKDLTYTKFGIDLVQKKSLVETRLNRTLIKEKLTNYTDYIEWMLSDPSKKRLSEFIDKMSTNFTYFYREPEHYEFLIKNIELIGSLSEIDKNKQFRLWSAGCSYGDEPYTYAMVILHEQKRIGYDFDFKILATDINSEALEWAQKGIYPESRLTYLPEKYKKAYLTKIDGENYKVSDEIKQHILFKRLNFMNDSFPFKNVFHVISCRNVMIYFDKETKEELLKKFHSVLYKFGFFILGKSESFRTLDCEFKHVKDLIYKPTH